MSFSSSAKEEICKQQPSDCCIMAELCAITLVCSNISINSKGVQLKYNTENMAVAKRIFDTVTHILKMDADVEIKESRLKKKHVYTITVQDAKLLLSALGLEGDLFFSARPPKYMTETECCNAALVRGAFLGCGTVSNPKKNYRLEFVINSQEFADFLMDALEKYGIRAKKIVRKQNFVVYLIEGDSIADLLAVVGAHSSVLNFENVRILKEMRNNINRAVNCETANLDKTISAAMAQLESIRVIDEKMGLEKLSSTLIEAAELRKANPDATLKELCEISGTTKSGMNHRLRKICAIAAELKE